MRRRILMLPVLALVACAAPREPESDVLRQTSIAEQRWRATRPAQYAMTQRQLCFCPLTAVGPVHLRVEVLPSGEERITDARYAESAEPVAETFLNQAFRTVEDLFAVIRAAETRGADSIEVKFDERFGYPLAIRIDYLRNAADDEVTYEVTALEPAS